MTVNGEVVILDNGGYLVETDDGNLAIAGDVAEGPGIGMTDDHWFVVNNVRGYYAQTGCVPEARHALMAMDRIFPLGYGKMACRIAGMRNPLKLWLDL